MLFPEEDAPVLKEWIVKRLENTSDADADILADYVLALLHNASDGDNILGTLEEEITQFLKEDTKLFANELLQTIRYKSYIPGAPPPPKPQPAPISQPSQGTPSLAPSSSPAGPAAGPRKRAFQDRGDFDAPNGREQFQGGGRSFKQPRRGGGGFGRRGYIDPDAPQPVQQLAQHGGYPGAPGGQNALPYAPTGPVAAAAAAMPNFVAAADPAEAMRQLQQLSQQIGMQMAQMSGFSPQPGFLPHQPPPQKKRGRCRDYDNKGYCARGQNCKFEHTNGPDSTSFNLPVPQMSGQIQLPTEEYDPNTATMMAPSVMPQFSQQQPSNGNSNNRRDNRQGQNQRRTGPPRASFSAAGPVHDKTQTKVVVESIPEENFNEEQVRGFFSQYGNIEEVTMMPYKRLAIVKYDNWGSANAAYRSPKVIFDNRFVKVFWYKDEKHADIGNGGANGPKNGAAAAANGSGDALANGQEDEPELDMEEFTRRQEEAQKTHEEKMRKKQELEEQRAELEKRQKELQAKHEAEKQRLLAKLASSRKNSSETDADGTGSEDKAGDGSKSSQNEALRATLAKLQEEAKAFGLDPHASPEHDAMISTYSSGYTPRGRGGFPRGRGGYAPRASYRGRGGRGNIHAAYAAFSLDNRPRKVAMSGVDFSAPDKDEALRQHLFSLGEFAAEIQVTAAVTHISFNDRKAAEKFYNSIGNNKTLPGLPEGEEVELSWVSNAAGPLPGSATSKIDFTSGATANNAGNGDDIDSLMVMDSSHATTGQQNGAGQHEATGGEVDYDVAGENEWDID